MTAEYLEYSAKLSTEKLDYTWDWKNDLADGETVTAVEIEVSGGVQIVGAPATTGTVTKYRLAGGVGPMAKIDLLATTSAGTNPGVRIHLPIVV